MAATLFHRILLGFVVSSAAIAATAQARACPFCDQMQGEPLAVLVEQSRMVLYGKLQNPQLKSGANELGEGTTELVIETVIKDHEIRGGNKVVSLPRYVPVKAGDDNRFLVFCDVFKGRIDPYHGCGVKAQCKIDSYLIGAVALKDKPLGQRLRFYFDYLDSPHLDIANDALRWFARTRYEDYRDMAKDLPPDRIAKWLQDKDTPASRYGLYASLLAHCGKEEHAQLLRSLLDDPKKRSGSGVDGMLSGYILLKPKEGWEYLRGILNDPSQKLLVRHAAMRATRFFHDSRPDVINKKDVVDAVCLLLEQNDLADLAVEELRKWKHGEVADRVVVLYDKKSHNIPIIQRSILRYALSFPQQPRAAELIQRLRSADPQMVKDAEELLKWDEAAPAGPVKTTAK